jgi:hypothetical protein
MGNQMGETRRGPNGLCECMYSPVELQGSTSLAVTQNPSTSVCLNSFELDSEAKNLDNHKTSLNSSMRIKKLRILKKNM